MAKKKQKSNTLIYLALAVGGAFLIHKYFMKSAEQIKSPVEPNNPTPESGTIKTMVYNNPDQDHNTQNYYTETGTYQSFYGKVNGTISNKVPILC
jgi:hypothetical protein